MRITAALAAIALVGGLAGCSDDDPGPSTLPRVSVAPSPTAVAALPVPSEAVAETPQGAAAFARYYLSVVDEAFATQITQRLVALSDPGCGGCRSFIEAINPASPPSERFEGGRFNVQFAEAPPVEGGDVIVSLRYNITESRVLRPDGSLLRTEAATTPTDAQMRLVRRGNSWIVQGFRNVSP